MFRISLLLTLALILMGSCRAQEGQPSRELGGHRETVPELIGPKPFPDTIYSKKGVTGILIVQATVDTTGRVVDVEVVRSFSPYYDSIAVKRARQMEFKPAKRYSSEHPEGKPIPEAVGFPFVIRPKGQR